MVNSSSYQTATNAILISSAPNTCLRFTALTVYKTWKIGPECKTNNINVTGIEAVLSNIVSVLVFIKDTPKMVRNDLPKHCFAICFLCTFTNQIYISGVMKKHAEYVLVCYVKYNTRYGNIDVWWSNYTEDIHVDDIIKLFLAPLGIFSLLINQKNYYIGDTCMQLRLFILQLLVLVIQF